MISYENDNVWSFPTPHFHVLGAADLSNFYKLIFIFQILLIVHNSKLQLETLSIKLNKKKSKVCKLHFLSPRIKSLCIKLDEEILELIVIGTCHTERILLSINKWINPFLMFIYYCVRQGTRITMRQPLAPKKFLLFKFDFSLPNNPQNMSFKRTISRWQLKL